MPEPVMSNRHVEDLAIQLLLDRAHKAGRKANDVRGKGALVDIEGDYLIEVKAFSGSARGSDLWLETRQVQAALDHPERFHLVIVDNISTGKPQVRDISGSDLSALLERRREKHYYEVPLPTATYDSLIGQGATEAQ